MIEINKGRARSVRTEQELVDLAKSSFDILTDDEQKAVLEILEQLQVGRDDLVNLISKSQWERDPVTMRQFLEDPYYMGIAGESLYPKLKDNLINLYDSHGYNEVIAMGAIGWGKSVAASFIAARELYEISCLRDPARTFGLSPGSELHIALISKNLEQTKKVLRSKIIEPLRLSPYFTEHFPWVEKEWEDRFPKNVIMFVASVNSQDRILGSNLFSALIDEVNFLGAHSIEKMGTADGKKGLATYDKAEKLYRLLQRRIKSRFMDGGVLPGKLVLISSKTVTGSFTERRVKEARYDPGVYVMDYATWDVKPSTQFTGETFDILIGRGSLKSKILEPGEVIPEDALDATGSYTIKVPEEYRGDFEEDLHGALRDVAGVSTDAFNQFIGRQERVYAAIDESFEHPMSAVEWVFGQQIAFNWTKLCTRQRNRLHSGHEEMVWQPVVNPSASRHVHIDVALSQDCVGIAMGHVARDVEVLRRSPSMEVYSDVAQHVQIDFMLKVWPPPGGEILLSEVRSIVYALIDHGFNVTSLTCDSFQSADTLQQFRSRGVKAEVLSVDRTAQPYMQLRQALYENRVTMYRYQPLIEELMALEHNAIKGKVDHPPGGSKDIADAVAGVVAGLIQFAGRAPLGLLGAVSGEDEEDFSWVMGSDLRMSGSHASKPVHSASGFDAWMDSLIDEG